MRKIELRKSIITLKKSTNNHISKSRCSKIIQFMTILKINKKKSLSRSRNSVQIMIINRNSIPAKILKQDKDDDTLRR